jgi:molybdate transport system regulatory protein
MQPELWIKLTFPGIGQIGPGKVKLLRNIAKHNSISAAARAMDMSYRRAWLLVEEVNGLFEKPVVTKWQGGESRGGASLTEFGEALIEHYDTLVRQSTDANRALLKKIGRSSLRQRKKN